MGRFVLLADDQLLEAGKADAARLGLSFVAYLRLALVEKLGGGLAGSGGADHGVVPPDPVSLVPSKMGLCVHRVRREGCVWCR